MNLQTITLSALGLLALGAADVHAQALPPGCHPTDRAACLYQSDLDYPDAAVDGLLYDAARDYDIPVKVRYPVGAESPRPVVIWNHGGQPGVNGRGRSETWGRLLARAGYVVIHPSRVAWPGLYRGFEATCVANGIGALAPPGTPLREACSIFVAQHLHGPRNTHFIIDNLHLIEALHPDLDRLLDAERIAVAGYSAGSGVTLANAGAPRQFRPGGPVYEDRHDAPTAFLATGLVGTTLGGWSFGFHADGFQAIDRPFLSITGIGDQNGVPTEAKSAAWLNSEPGDQVLVWDREPEAVHETMELDRCDTRLRRLHCRWLGAAGLAFLDAVIRERPAARGWLASEAMAVLSDDAVGLHRR